MANILKTPECRFKSLYLILSLCLTLLITTSKANAQMPAGQWSQIVALNSVTNEVFSSGSTLYAGTEGGGVYRSGNGGLTWELSNSGLFAGASVRTFAIAANGLFIATNKGVYRSNDQGATWTEVNNGLTYTSGSAQIPRPITALTTIGMSLIAGAGKVDGVSGITVSIFRSDNLGQSWSEVKTGLPAITACTGLAYGPSGLFAATDAGVYRSPDNGVNWASANFQNAVSVATTGQNVFAMRKEGIWRSADLGQTWTQIFTAGGEMVKLLASGSNLFAVDQYILSQTSALARISFSPDQGQSWFDTEYPVNAVTPFTVTGINLIGDKLYGCSGDARIFARSGFFSPGIATFSSASYLDRSFAAASLATTFGSNFATSSQSATTMPLPLTLLGATVKVKDSLGVERDSPLLFVSPGQINFQIPPGTANGNATVTVFSNGVNVGAGQIFIQRVAPALFTANANGYGVVAGSLLRVKADGTQQYESIAEFDSAAKEFVAKPIDLGPATDQCYLVFFGTGLQFRSALSAVKIKSEAPDIQVAYAGPQGLYVGLDQVNVLLPRTLAGRGQFFFYLEVDTVPSNVTIINIK